MTNKYKLSKEVPTGVLAERLAELSDACVRMMKGDKATFEREFTFRIPAELDRDADLVLSESSERLVSQYKEIQTLKAKIAELEKIKDELHDKVFRILSILGIYPDFGDIVCNGCDGIGKKVYANTSTYLKGIGGQSMTDDICDECWGSGKSNAPFRNLRKLREQVKQLERGE